ncbi:MAG: tRNA (adenosine(37)-N6)-dimethylallyltransferase MiaA [Bacteroidota bacterium]|nr:tRNA (adenosine(37)-N6)-dimethylallyltransferase MiaA [Bacteroidota bacterium]
MYDKTCIIITGATAAGKTDRAVELAEKYNTQIISSDSRQCYKELNIGVAKPSQKQLHKVHHYFIDSHSVHEEVNVKTFEKYALNAVNEIFQNNDVAIMVGGTGLYIKAFCGGLDDIPAIDKAVHSEIDEAYKLKGIAWLREEIKNIDPAYFSLGEVTNPRRIMRALEVKLATGKSILDFQSGKKVQRNFKIKQINLEIPRDELYQRINKRVDIMMDEGLLKEAEKLYAYKNLNALQTVGYKELFDFIDGKTSLGQAIDDIKKNTRHFAKRQFTWFKKYNC